MPKEYIMLTERQERLARKLVKAKSRGDIDVPDAIIAALFGCSASKISNIRTGRDTTASTTSKQTHNRKKLPVKVQKRIKKLCKDGKSIREIQLAASVSYTTAQRYRAKFLAEMSAKVDGGATEAVGVGG